MAFLPLLVCSDTAYQDATELETKTYAEHGIKPETFNMFAEDYQTIKNSFTALKGVSLSRFEYFHFQTYTENTAFLNKRGNAVQEIDQMYRTHLTNSVHNFVHLCDEQGGAAEYVLAMRGWYCTLLIVFVKERYDVDLDAWSTFCPVHRVEIFAPRYGISDITLQQTRDDLVEEVRTGETFIFTTIDPGVDLVVADGGMVPLSLTSFTKTGQTSESVYLTLLASQAHAALQILAKQGKLLLRLEHMFMLSTVETLYMVAVCFEKIAICRPRSCLPGTHESFFVGLGFNGDPTGRCRDFLKTRAHVDCWTPLIDPEVWSNAGRWFGDFVKERSRALCLHQRLCLEAVRQNSVDSLRMEMTRFHVSAERLTSIMASSRLLYGKATALPQNEYQLCVDYMHVIAQHALRDDDADDGKKQTWLMAALVPTRPRDHVMFLFVDKSGFSKVSAKERRFKTQVESVEAEWSRFLAPGTVVKVQICNDNLRVLQLLEILATQQDPLLYTKQSLWTQDDHTCYLRRIAQYQKADPETVVCI